jgi:hypothetical protein
VIYDNVKHGNVRTSFRFNPSVPVLVRTKLSFDHCSIQHNLITVLHTILFHCKSRSIRASLKCWSKHITTDTVLQMEKSTGISIIRFYVLIWMHEYFKFPPQLQMSPVAAAVVCDSEERWKHSHFQLTATQK